MTKTKKSKETKLTLVRINQPSTLQPDHEHHWKRAFIIPEEARDSSKGKIVRAWFLDGDIVSADIFLLSTK